MKEKKIFDALTEVREDHIEEARTTRLKKQSISWKMRTVAAACAVLIIGVSGLLIVPGLLSFGGNTGSGSAGRGESSVFMSYAGPVFPLTLNEADSTIRAARSISYNFSMPYEDSLRIWGAHVTDQYTLSNDAAKDKTVKAIYPFAGSFDDLTDLTPVINVNGQEASPVLYAGRYSGGFTGGFAGSHGEEDSNSSINVVQLNSWEGYKKLLEDGEYENSAFAPYTELSQQVTVYIFSGFTAPEEYDAATQAISFTIDPDRTTLLMYGFNGGEIGDDGFRRFSFFVPNQTHTRHDLKMLIVIGDDITDYTLQGYKTGACEAGNELDGVSSTVTRDELILADVMDEIIDDFFAQYDQKQAAVKHRELFSGEVAEYMLQYGLLSEFVIDRYLHGMVEDIISETNTLKRVFYLEFEVTIPAGESVTINADMHKKPSYDFAGSGSNKQDLQGYDMVTRLGTNLHIDALTAEITSDDRIEIVRQNFGFNLPQGICQVTLNPAADHYYLEIRPVEY